MPGEYKNAFILRYTYSTNRNCKGCKMQITEIKVSSHYENLVLYHIERMTRVTETTPDLPVTHSHFALLSSPAESVTQDCAFHGFDYANFVNLFIRVSQ